MPIARIALRKDFICDSKLLYIHICIYTTHYIDEIFIYPSFISKNIFIYLLAQFIRPNIMAFVIMTETEVWSICIRERRNAE